MRSTPHDASPESDRTPILEARRRAVYSPVMPLIMAAVSGGLIFLLLSIFGGRFGGPLGFSSESVWVAAASALGIFVFLYVMQVITNKAVLHRDDEERPSDG